MYVKTTCRIKDKVEVSKHYHANSGAPGRKRAGRKDPTPEDMAKQNHWRRCRDLRRLIELNFDPGDWHVTLTCEKDKRPTMEEAPGVIRKFLGKLKRDFKKQGWDLKYVITCEVGDRGAVHWHMVVNSCHNEATDTAKLIREAWKRGRPYFSALDDSGEYERLADYMCKQAAQRIDRGETSEKMSYSRSRNLKKPVERREKVRASGWKQEPKVPEGWELVEGSLLNEVNKWNGLPYQHYTLRRKEGDRGKGESVRKDDLQGTKKAKRSVHVPPRGGRVERDGNEGRDEGPRGRDGERGKP